MIRILFIIFLAKLIEAARILAIFPTPSNSHQKIFKVLVNDLADRGHSITVLSGYQQNYGHSNITEIDIYIDPLGGTNMSWNDFKMMSHEVAVINSNEWKMRCHLGQMQIPEVQKLIQSEEKFDLIILEYFNHLTYLAFAEVFDCPVVGITSLNPYFYVHEDFNGFNNPLVEPDFYLSFLPDDMIFMERLRSLVFYISVKFILQPIQEFRYEKIIKQNFPKNSKSIKELKEKVEILLINSSPVMKSQPLAPNVISLGFLHIQPPKEIEDKKLKTFLDNSKRGVIYMSLGSLIESKNLSPKFINIFVEFFKSLPYDIIWKFETENLKTPSNVLISKWLPQADLLAHSNLKVFINHGGLLSVEEAIDREVPMITIPFIFDHKVNAKIIEKKKIGIRLELENLSVDNLRNAVNEVMKPVYKENIQRIKNLIYDQPMTSREKAIWWVEYVIRNENADELKYPGRKMKFYEICGLDIVAVFSLGLLIFWNILKFIKNLNSSLDKYKNE
jgi:glucuronosyltransferase